MVKSYRFKIEGSAADEQSWVAEGSLQCDLHDAFNYAMGEAFVQLTNGKAVFGKPGVGCRGPYDVHRVTIEQVKH